MIAGMLVNMEKIQARIATQTRGSEEWYGELEENMKMGISQLKETQMRVVERVCEEVKQNRDEQKETFERVLYTLCRLARGEKEALDREKSRQGEAQEGRGSGDGVAQATRSISTGIRARAQTAAGAASCIDDDCRKSKSSSLRSSLVELRSSTNS
jgi:hypothetical protein